MICNLSTTFANFFIEKRRQLTPIVVSAGGITNLLLYLAAMTKALI